jgi:hypothetical protein
MARAHEAQLLDFPASRLKALAHHLRLLEAQAPVVPEVPPFVLADDRTPDSSATCNCVVRLPGVYHQHGIARRRATRSQRRRILPSSRAITKPEHCAFP